MSRQNNSKDEGVPCRKHVTPVASTQPLISVVIPCRNEADHIDRCVASLLSQAPVPGGFEILVADGMSTDGTRQILARLEREVNMLTLTPSASDHNTPMVPSSCHRPGTVCNELSVPNGPILRIVDNPAKITPCGMNAGIRAARGCWIAIMGAHARYSPDFLARCLEVATETGADNVGGAMHCEGNTRIQKAIAAAHHSSFAVGGASWHNTDHEGIADTVFGGFYKREVFERIGYFDESLVRNQDDELNLRLVRAGGKIWHSPRIKSWYFPRKSLKSLFWQYYQYGYWKVRVIQKHRMPASWRHLVPGAFVLAVLTLFLVFLITCSLSLLIPDIVAPPLRYALPLWSAGLLILSLGTYVLTVVAASVKTAAKNGWTLLPLLPVVFPCYHVGYGCGFLRGVWDFGCRRTTKKAAFALTR